MAYYNENKNIKILVSVQGINRQSWYFEPKFRFKDDEDIPVNQIVPYFDTISQKTENDTANIKKAHSFVKKT